MNPDAFVFQILTLSLQKAHKNVTIYWAKSTLAINILDLSKGKCESKGFN